MTLPRIVTVAIFLFCGCMTTLLVRSVLYPENSRLAAVPSNVPFDLFAARSEGSILDVWDSNQIIGSCEFTPVSGTSPLQRRSWTKVRLTIRIQMRQKIADSDRLNLDGSFVLHSDGLIDSLSLTFSLPGTNPPWQLKADQKAESGLPVIRLTRGNETLFAWDGKGPANAMSAGIVDLMLGSSGMSLDTLTANKPKPAPAVRAGNLTAGDSTVDGYLMVSGEEESAFRLYLANTGEILRIDTPLTGENQLGLRLLAQSLRPSGVEPPDFTVLPVLRNRKP